ncbi:MAG TPA: EamA family transporter [Candidatus Sulfotelmatobacter sp.]|nr:EamA family transporter [Candidatus Sulfotelmatobacter sp.]
MASQTRITSTGTALLAPSSAKFVSKTHLLTAMVVLTNVVGNVCLSRGMQEVGRTVSASPADYLRALLNPWVLAGSCTLALWMISELALLSRADLTFVLPVTASAYVFIAIAGHFFLGDRISWQRWLGIVVISVGVILAEETPSLTSTVEYRERTR